MKKHKAFNLFSPSQKTIRSPHTLFRTIVVFAKLSFVYDSVCKRSTDIDASVEAYLTIAKIIHAAHLSIVRDRAAPTSQAARINQSAHVAVSN